MKFLEKMIQLIIAKDKPKSSVKLLKENYFSLTKPIFILKFIRKKFLKIIWIKLNLLKKILLRKEYKKRFQLNTFQDNNKLKIVALYR